MKKFLAFFVGGILFSTSVALAGVAEVSLKNPSSHRLWLADLKKP